jgi:hypothetical protein
MNIKITRTSTDAGYTLYDGSEATAMGLIRSHVRAIDDSEDDLLQLYLDAAIDYMQELSDRVLGASDVVVTLDYNEASRPVMIPKCQNAGSTVTIKYRKDDQTWSEDVLSATIPDPESPPDGTLPNPDYIEDLEYLYLYDRYPVHVNVADLLKKTTDRSDFNQDFVQLAFTAGTALGSLPKQYRQAALLLVGHYYNMREAENIGGITVELKEGVRRLIQSVRQY